MRFKKKIKLLRALYKNAKGNHAALANLRTDFIFFSAFSSLANAGIVGKVVGVADGETIIAFQERTQQRIRPME